MKKLSVLITFLFVGALAIYSQEGAKMLIHQSSTVVEYLLSEIDSITFKIPETQAAVHPSLFLKKGEEAAMLERIERSPLLSKVHKSLISECAPILRTAVSKYQISANQLLDVSEEVFRRVFLLSYAYRVTGTVSYAVRAEKELLAAARFQDWHPSHWLDTATLLAAMGIGYDWLYDYLSEESRIEIREAIVEKGLNTVWEQGFNQTNNWNSVCNGGMVVAALAVRDVYPELTKKLVEKAVASNPKVLTMYAPDGGYPEGYGYWGYGTTYQCLMSAALIDVYGTDYGLSDYPGFMESARFRQFTTAPTGKCWNYSDCAEAAYISPCVFWMAYRKNDPSLLAVEARYLESTIPYSAGEIFKPFITIYGSRLDLTSVPENSNHFWYSGGVTPIYVYRSGWKETTDTYLGIKGGYAASNHSHMDGGSFCYEYGGVRWSKDLGLQSYGTLESVVTLWDMTDASTRWNVFRLGNSSHSTLTINNKHHKVNGVVFLKDTYMTDKKQGALADMSGLYSEDVDLILRDITLEGNILTIKDSVEAKPTVDCDIQWIMNTEATSEKESDNSLVLSYLTKKMRMVVDAPCDFSLLQLTNVGPNSYDIANSGCRVGVQTKFPAGFKGTITVKLIPIE